MTAWERLEWLGIVLGLIAWVVVMCMLAWAVRQERKGARRND